MNIPTPVAWILRWASVRLLEWVAGKQPDVDIEVRKTGVHPVENGGVKGIFTFFIVNNGGANAEDPRIKLELPRWNIGRRQSAMVVRLAETQVHDPSEDPDVPADHGSENSDQSQTSDTGLNFSDSTLNLEQTRTMRFGGGEEYDIKISGIIPAGSSRDERLCFGTVVLDQEQSNTILYEVSTRNTPAREGTITFEADHSDINVHQSELRSPQQPQGIRERVAGRMGQARSKMPGVATREEVEILGQMDVVFVDEDYPPHYSPCILVRLSPHVDERKDIIGKLNIQLSQDEGRETIGTVTLHALSIEPGEQWATFAPKYTTNNSVHLVDKNVNYARGLGSPLPIPVDEIDGATIDNLRMNWQFEIDDPRRGDTRKIRIENEKLDREFGVEYEADLVNENNTSRSVFVVAKFYANSGEILYTPSKSFNIDGNDMTPIEFRFELIDPRQQDRVDKCKAIVVG